jgi:hypothetical protein
MNAERAVASRLPVGRPATFPSGAPLSLWRCLILSLVFIAASGAASAEVRLVNGVVTYTAENGARKSVDVGRQCVDLWVAPDESVIAFIAIDRSGGTDEGGGPFVLASSIYVARKAESFNPSKVPVGTVRDNGQRVWEAFRNPSVSPDGKTVIFVVPAAMTGGFIVAHDLRTHPNETIGDETDYCNVWTGSKAGFVLVQERYLDPAKGYVQYRCYLKRLGGKATSDEGAACQEFNRRRVQGGACSPAPQ